MSKHQSRQRSDNRKTHADNLRLRRENSRLKKVIQKLYGAINSMTYKGFTAEENTKKEESVPATPEKTCPECQSKAAEIDLGQFKYWFCSTCSWREKKSGI